MVIAWNLYSLDNIVRGNITYIATAREKWLDLKERFGQGNAPRIHQIKLELALLNQEGTTVTTYYTKLKALCDELTAYNPMQQCSCGAAKELMQQQKPEKLHQFLMGLNIEMNIEI